MRFIIYIGIIFCTAASTSPTPELHPGDLLFRAGRNSAMTGAITAATGRIEAPGFSHVGIFVRYDGTDAVLEAAPEGGVRISPLREFLDGSARIDGRPAAVAMRLRDTAGLAASLRRAFGFLGLPYDCSFRPDNGKLYCSELVWESYRTPDGRRRFPARPMNFRAADGSMPAFWTELFERARGSDPRRGTGDQPERYGARSAIVRGRPLVLKRRGGQTIRSTVMSGFARSRSIYPSSAAVPLARITSVARCTTPSGVRAASTS